MAYGTRRNSAAHAEIVLTNPIPISAPHSKIPRSSQSGLSPTHYRSNGGGSFHNDTYLTPISLRRTSETGPNHGGGGSSVDDGRLLSQSSTSDSTLQTIPSGLAMPESNGFSTSFSSSTSSYKDPLDESMLSSSIGKTRRPSTLAAQRRRLSNTISARPLKDVISTKSSHAVVDSGTGLGMESEVRMDLTGDKNRTMESIQGGQGGPAASARINYHGNGSLSSPSSSLPSTVNILTIGHGNSLDRLAMTGAAETNGVLNGFITNHSNGHTRARSISVGSGGTGINDSGLQLSGLKAPLSSSGGEMIMMELGDGEDGEVKIVGHLGKKEKAHLFECEKCNKVYRHSTCLVKHRWEHTAHWKEASKLLLSKHQQVQLLEAAAILKAASLGSSLPDEKSYWPAAVSPPSSGLLGSQSLNINTVLSPRLFASQPLRSVPSLGELPGEEESVEEGVDDIEEDEEEGEGEERDEEEEEDLEGGSVTEERFQGTVSRSSGATGAKTGSTSASTEGTDSLSEEIDNDQDDANESVSTFGTTSGDGDGDYQQAHMMLVDDMFDMEIDSDESNLNAQGQSVVGNGSNLDAIGGLVVSHHHHHHHRRHGMVKSALAGVAQRSHSVGQDSGFGSLPEVKADSSQVSSDGLVGSRPLSITSSTVREGLVSPHSQEPLSITKTITTTTTTTPASSVAIAAPAAPAMGFFSVNEQNKLKLMNHKINQLPSRRNGLSVSPSAVV